jgi:hypothetical protein
VNFRSVPSTFIAPKHEKNFIEQTVLQEITLVLSFFVKEKIVSIIQISNIVTYEEFKSNHINNDIQSIVTSSYKVDKKKKFRKKLLKYSFSEISKSIYMSRRYWSCETKHHQNDNIVFIRYFMQWLRYINVTPTQSKYKKSKNWQKTKKYVFFKFLIRVKSNTYKKWDVGSIYTLL